MTLHELLGEIRRYLDEHPELQEDIEIAKDGLDALAKLSESRDFVAGSYLPTYSIES